MGIGGANTVDGFRRLFKGFSDARLASVHAGPHDGERLRTFFDGFLSARARVGDNDETAVIGRVVARKHELREMLSKGETERFVDIIVGQLEELATLIPAIDEVLGTKSKTSR